MKKPVLVIMAAGMGSRYGGLKQIDPIDKEGHIIMDFSIYDAKRAGFEKVVFIIKKENETDFKEAVGKRIEKVMDVAYVYQELTNIPDGFEIPKDRVKPWGTAHAVLSAIDEIDGPFAVINADDYYGRHAFQTIYDYLTTHEDDDKYRYTMVAYRLKNTVTDNGHVARGICGLNASNELVSVTERTRIEKRNNGIEYSEDDGQTWNEIDPDTLVSMNMWGFTPQVFGEMKKAFDKFIDENGMDMKAHYSIPAFMNERIADGVRVKVIETPARWMGLVSHDDKIQVLLRINDMIRKGIYPSKLF